MRPIRWSSLVVAAVLIVCGGWVILSTMTSRPHDDAIGRAFRADATCRGEATLAHDARGACSYTPATVIATEIRRQGTIRHRGRLPYVRLHLATGTVDEERLAGDAGLRFAENVHAGDRARVQFYRSLVVRVVSGAYSAETPGAPDVEASSDLTFAWIGAGAVGLGLIVLYAATRRTAKRRAAA